MKILGNIANQLSILRIFLVVPLYFLVKDYHIFGSSILLILIVLSDVLDGYFARKLNSQGLFGKVLDHGVDKVVSIFISFMLYRYFGLPSWAFYFFVGRDLLILLFGAGILFGFKVAFGSLWIGKVAGGFYFAMAFAYLLNFSEVANVLMIISVALFLVVLLVYTVKFFPTLKESIMRKEES
ncbi:MAG TPA: CDP-alcohol phosphatidyltransferase family protein [Candidatus Hydrothermia bacterium]|nr:CDP-alcohol phosphatidyltransferase family protein [Candidatus Hydrothermae bacterium]MDD3649034.1 CDP-alcohol phosphatidyltransferase family protein [Candidatus Hydrothermia bacterium]MDD5573268.1 CDP-alcohol phosphatidyltransferase family protein [Candidatus Hydrothermia bacterium]HOK22973.1 CDP-alcohol phosphatidyltransferase family protein [Candidatus Hydrothermia bacterium]HOL23767.1 CDP-alcohol phosphatidyltransferase family protein [Candidatus Hydrothermia bacterium]